MKRRGSILLLVLWTTAIIAIAVFGLSAYLQVSLDEDVYQFKKFRARQLAESGIALGLHPTVKRSDPILSYELNSIESFEVVVTNEGARLPLNAIIEAGNREIIRNVFIAWGLNLEEADTAIDSLFDWVDDDEFTRLKGAENEYYASLGQPDYPRDRPFQNLEEVLAVRGMERVAELKPDWQDHFTIWSSGKINLNEITADLAVWIFDIPERQAESFISIRDGLDGESYTEDDITYASLDQIRQNLGVNPTTFEALEPLLSLEDSTLRIESTGRVESFSYPVTLVARRESSGTQIIRWLNP